MPFSSLIEVVDAMKDKLEAVLAASPFSAQVDAYRNLVPTPPSIDIYPFDPFTEQAAASFKDHGEVSFVVRARIGTADNDAGQDFLLRLMDEHDPLSVIDALEDDQTLNGTAGSIFVQGPSGHRIYEDIPQTGAFLGVEWKATVIRASS